MFLVRIYIFEMVCWLISKSQDLNGVCLWENLLLMVFKMAKVDSCYDIRDMFKFKWLPMNLSRSKLFFSFLLCSVLINNFEMAEWFMLSDTVLHTQTEMTWWLMIHGNLSLSVPVSNLKNTMLKVAYELMPLIYWLGFYQKLFEDPLGVLLRQLGSLLFLFFVYFHVIYFEYVYVVFWSVDLWPFYNIVFMGNRSSFQPR